MAYSTSGFNYIQSSSDCKRPLLDIFGANPILRPFNLSYDYRKEMSVLSDIKKNARPGDSGFTQSQEQTSWTQSTIMESELDGAEQFERYLYLVVIKGKDMGRRFLLSSRRMSMGRSTEADISIYDERISRIHCSIIRQGSSVIVEDHGSTNGTLVNGKKIEKAEVPIDAVIQIGRTEMKFSLKTNSELAFEEQLRRDATIDGLTGTLNRKHFMERALEELEYAARSNLPIGLLMIDIDLFKDVNDTHGHPAGDYILIQMTSLIEREKRRPDLFGRYGGEEFILLTRGIDSLENCRRFCERLRQKVESYHFRFDETDIPITVSIGYCFKIVSALDSLDDFIENADRALYRAKNSGRNRVDGHDSHNEPDDPSKTG